MKKDIALILGSAGLRSAAISFSSVLLGLYLAARGFNAAVLTTAVACGLAGCVVGIGFAHWAVRGGWGTRRTLAVVSLLMALGGLMLAFGSGQGAIYSAAFLGMLNGMGRDRGAGLTLDQTMLPNLVSAQKRTWVFSWYSLVSDMGNAVGALCAVLPVLIRKIFLTDDLTAYQFSWMFYSALCLVAGAGALCLSARIEQPVLAQTKALSVESRPKVFRFAALSSLDSFGGGFLSTALMGYWFFQRFGLNEAVIGPLFFAARCANGVSHLGAAWLAKRIGLVNTMVFTHLPSSFVLMTIPIAPNFAVAATLFLLRETLVEMDLPTRQSYLMSIVPAQDRTAAAALTNGVRVSAWTVGSLMAGPLMALAGLSAPLIAGAGLKMMYDLLLYRSFRGLRPPEEKF